MGDELREALKTILSQERLIREQRQIIDCYRERGRDQDRIGVSAMQIRRLISQLDSCKVSAYRGALLRATLEEIALAFESQEAFWEARFTELQEKHLAEVKEVERRCNEQIGRLSAD